MKRNKNSLSFNNSFRYSIFDKVGKKGFSLIEMLIVMAIIGILTAVVIVNLQGARIRGQTGRALAQASSVVPSIISCWGNGGNVNSNTSGDICSLGASYGTWPNMSAIGYSISSNESVSGKKRATWFFTATSDEGGSTICCNSAMNSCGILVSGVDCNETTTW